MGLSFVCGPGRDCQTSTFERDELKVRVSILLETIETLQAGERGEKEQRIVSLTAQLTASSSKQAILESRIEKLHVSGIVYKSFKTCVKELIGGNR